MDWTIRIAIGPLHTICVTVVLVGLSRAPVFTWLNSVVSAPIEFELAPLKEPRKDTLELTTIVIAELFSWQVSQGQSRQL